MTLEDLKPLIGAEIRRRRLEMGVIQGELAKKIGVSRAYWTMMEGRQSPTNLDGLFKVCGALGCNFTDFFGSILGVANNPPAPASKVISNISGQSGLSAEVTVIFKCQ